MSLKKILEILDGIECDEERLAATILVMTMPRSRLRDVIPSLKALEKKCKERKRRG